MNALGLIILLIVGALASVLFACAYRIANAKPCRHKWVHEQLIRVYREGVSQPTGYEYILRCEHCGDLRKRRF